MGGGDGWNHRKAKRRILKKKEAIKRKKEEGKKAFATASVAGVTGSPLATAAAAPRALLSGMLSPEEEWRWRRCSAGNSPLCGVLLRWLLGCESGGDESAGTEPWRRSCVPGNRWVAQATAPCDWPACLPVLRTRPALCMPFLVLIPSPAGSALPWLAVTLTAAIGRTGGRLQGCRPSGLRRCTGE